MAILRGMQNHEILARPIDIGPLASKNRIVMPPLVIWKSDRSGEVGDDHVEHYARSVGPALMIVEATTVASDGRLAGSQLGIWSDEHIAGLRRLADVIHDSGALAGIQIHHAGASSSLEENYGEAPKVPSIVEHSPDGAEEMSASDIEATVAAFANAAARAVTAGFDVIELHGAHGYLIAQFLSPATNQRTDDWGGSPEKRRRFMVEVIRAVRQRIGAEGAGATGTKNGDAPAAGRPIAVTIRLGLAASGKRRLAIDEGLEAADAAVAAGVDAIHVSHAGGIDDELGRGIRAYAGSVVGDEAASEFELTILLAAMAKDRLAVPIIGVGGILTPEAASKAIEGGYADMIAVGRAILADPMWAQKALGGVDSPIEMCRQCKPRCFWFKEPPKCPARIKLAQRGEQPAVV